MTVKSILITGCSSNGIGAAVAQALAKQGHLIFATARNISKIPSELSELPNVTVLELDVLSSPSVTRAYLTVAEATKRRQGVKGLDVLVNNAGSGYTMPVLDIDLAKARQVFETNFWGPIRTIQTFSSLLIAKEGRVVNISSVGAALNTPWIATYCSSKAALTTMSETLRLELAPFGVTVVTIMLGTIASQFHSNEPTPVLPARSRYAAALETMTRWAKGEAGPKGGPVEDVMDSLIFDIVGGSRGGLAWRGPNSAMVKFITSWMPTFITDYIVSSGQGLDAVSESLQEDPKSSK